MIRPLIACATLSLGSIGGILDAAAPKLYLIGSDQDAATQPEFGALLMGGGTEPDDAVEWLLEKAQGGDVVVLRASGSDGYNPYFYEGIGGVNSVRSYVFSAREESFDAAMLDALERAELVFLAGGDQSKYLRYWKGTPVQTLLNQHLRAGKPIGGTSAGLAVLGDTVYAAYGDSIRSRTALKDPFSEDLTLERGFLAVPFLENVITDSHFSERGRLGRLVAFQAAAAELRDGSPPIGLGVDEETALAIAADGRARVFSRNRGGRVYLSVFAADATVRRQPDTALSVSAISIIGLGRDSQLKLPQFDIAEAAEFSRAAVIEGRIRERPENSQP